ncbi:MAG: hypothetical protein RL261_1847 [Pseudomonadota bacterium]
MRGALRVGGAATLPQADFAIVELRDTAPPREVVAEQRIELRGRTVPVPFELVVNRDRLASDRTYAVRGALKKGVEALWVTAPVVIDITSNAADVGLLELKPAVVTAFATYWDCGSTRLALGMVGERFTLLIDGQAFEMRPVVAASGEKFEAVGDPSTSLWDEGPRATLTVRGTAYPQCARLDNPD